MKSSHAFVAAFSLFGSVACGQVADDSSGQPLTPKTPTCEAECPAGSHAQYTNDDGPPAPGTSPDYFCAPDAPVECAALVACAEDEYPVDPGTEGARAITGCGQTVYCAPTANCMGDIGCAADEIQVDAGTESARENTYCGVTIYCAPDGQIDCTAFPSCDAGEIQVPAGTPGSHDVELCRQTISCANDPNGPQPGDAGAP